MPIAVPGQGAASLHAADWLALLFSPDGTVAFWDERWEKLTGLDAAEVAGAASELILDWLFPVQHDRELVDDLLQQPVGLGKPQGLRKVLHVLQSNGSRLLPCLWLPVALAGEGGRRGWLLLVEAQRGAQIGMDPEGLRSHPAGGVQRPHGRVTRTVRRRPAPD